MNKDILLTNDDGIQSIGLRSLLRELGREVSVAVVAPEQARSAAGLSLTVHKPLRISKVLIDGFDAYAVSGTTGDCVMIALGKILIPPPKLICSGINIGENLSFSEFFMSGTVAGAIAGAVNGVPSIAFSKREPHEDVVFVGGMTQDYLEVARLAASLALAVMSEGLPEGVDFLNVNFPETVGSHMEFEFTSLARRSFEPEVFEKTDPRGRSYVWVWGDKYTSFPAGSDAHAVIEEAKVSITPIHLEGLSSVPEDVNSHLKRILDRVREVEEIREESQR